MTFNTLNLRTPENNKEGGDILVYDSGSDTLATVMASGYFNAGWQKLNVGDVIMVSHTTGISWLRVSARGENTVTVVGESGVTEGLTADVGSIQGGLPILTRIWVVDTVAVIGDSTTLPVATPGAVYHVANRAANSMDVFPASGGKINAGATDAAQAVAGGTSVTFVGINTTDWLAVVGA
jgi:hypothetical protein